MSPQRPKEKTKQNKQKTLVIDPSPSSLTGLSLYLISPWWLLSH